MSTPGKTKTDTVTTQTEPWKPAQAPLKNLIDSGYNIFVKDVLGDPNTPGQRPLDQLFARRSDNSDEGLNFQANAGRRGENLSRLAGREVEATVRGDGFGRTSAHLDNLNTGLLSPQLAEAARGGFSTETGGLLDFTAREGRDGGTVYALDRAARGSLDSDQGAVKNFLAETGGVSQRYLEDTASGKMLGSNPHLDKIRDQITERVKKSVGDQFSSSGLFGSTTHGEELGEGLGRALADFDSNIYNQERDRQISAASTITSENAQDQGRRLSAAQTLQGAETSDSDRQLRGILASQDGFESSRNRELDGLRAATAIENNNNDRRLSATGRFQDSLDRKADRGLDIAKAKLAADEAERDRQFRATVGSGDIARGYAVPGSILRDAGAGREAYSQREIDEINYKRNFWDNRNREALERYADFLGPIAGLGGSTRQDTPYYSNRGAGLIGGVLGGAGAGAQIGSFFPGVGTGVGAGVGAGLGLLGGFI